MDADGQWTIPLFVEQHGLEPRVMPSFSMIASGVEMAVVLYKQVVVHFYVSYSECRALGNGMP